MPCPIFLSVRGGHAVEYIERSDSCEPLGTSIFQLSMDNSGYYVVTRFQSLKPLLGSGDKAPIAQTKRADSTVNVNQLTALLLALVSGEAKVRYGYTQMARCAREPALQVDGEGDSSVLVGRLSNAFDSCQKCRSGCCSSCGADIVNKPRDSPATALLKA